MTAPGRVVVFEQTPPRRDESRPQRLIAAMAASARRLGIRVIALPPDFDQITAAEALERLPRGMKALGVLCGFIAGPEYYAELAAAAAARGVAMINPPEQSRTLMEFDRFYPLIADLTARSVVVRVEDDCARAFAELPAPVFVKGLIKSRKELGWEACVAHDAVELAEMLRQSRRFELSERGVLIAREILPLRRNGHLLAGFPVAREYRLYVLDGSVIGSGFYWQGHDDYGPLRAAERVAVDGLALTAAARVGARFAAVDVGQLEDGSWRVVELGDPQYSGVAHMSHLALWHALREAASHGGFLTADSA